MAASGPARILDQTEYISVSAVTAANGSAFTAAHFASWLRVGAAALCRSELAREKLTGAAFIQEARVIVDVFREQELGAPSLLQTAVFA